jgi:hypothetical protein
MAQWIADHLDDTARRFVDRSAAGQKAGVRALQSADPPLTIHQQRKIL